jgi:hypothetical protein
MALPNIIEYLINTYGNSSDESRQAVINAHRDIKQLTEAAEIWAEHHHVSSSDILVAYATAVDLGYRMGIKGERNEIIKLKGGKNL